MQESSILNPQLSEQQLVIKTNKALVERLEVRLLLIRKDYATKTEFEQNEVEISEIRTNTQIDLLKSNIAEMEMFFLETFRELISEDEKQFAQ